MIKSKFSVTMRCNKYKKDTIQAEDKLDPVKVDLELYLGEEDARNFIFKQSPIAFFVDEFKVLMKPDNNFNWSITLFKDEYIYIVLNSDQVLSYIEENYINLVVMRKVANVLSFDFDAAVDLISPPAEEF
jgi:hypothetical protein